MRILGRTVWLVFALALMSGIAEGQMDEKTLLETLSRELGIPEFELLNEWGELSDKAEAGLEKRGDLRKIIEEFEREETRQSSQEGLEEYLAIVRERGITPNSALVKIYLDHGAVMPGTLSTGVTRQEVSPSVSAASSRHNIGSFGRGTNLNNAASEAELLALIDSVPQVHQPIAVRVVSYLNLIPGFGAPSTNHVVYPIYLFADNIATDCWNLDPVSRDFGAAVRDGDDNCEKTRWRKRGEDYEVLDDGEWWDGAMDAGVDAFTRGQRLDFGLVATDGFVLDTALGSTNSMSYDGIVMRPDGTLTMDSESVVSMSGGGAVGYVEGSQGPRNYRYAVSGYIIALDDGSGPVLMYIAPVLEKGRVKELYFADNFYYSEK